MLPLEKSVSKTSAPPVAAALRQRAKECIAHFVARANAELGARMPMPTCSFDLRGKTAGRAHLQTNHVQLNAVLLTENADAFMNSTIPHEVAHLVTYKLFGDKVSHHGPEWQGVMRAFGLVPRRCHSYDTTNSAVASTQYRYACGCKTFTLSARRHAKARLGRYGCKRCKRVLRFTGEICERGVWSTVDAAAPRPAAVSVPPKAPATSAPSDALILEMSELALKLRLNVPNGAFSRMEVAERFLVQARALLAAAPASSPAAAPRAADGTDAPTDKQLAYAQGIARRKNLTIDATTLRSRRLLSGWIDQNK